MGVPNYRFFSTYHLKNIYRKNSGTNQEWVRLIKNEIEERASGNRSLEYYWENGYHINGSGRTMLLNKRGISDIYRWILKYGKTNDISALLVVLNRKLNEYKQNSWELPLDVKAIIVRKEAIK